MPGPVGIAEVEEGEEKAEEELSLAKDILTKSYFAKSLNCSYYAMFHAARALLATEKIDSKNKQIEVRLSIPIISLSGDNVGIARNINNPLAWVKIKNL